MNTKLTLATLVAASLIAHPLFAETTGNDWYQQGIKAKYYLKDQDAKGHFLQAASTGHVEAQYELAILLLNEELIQEQPHIQSIHWLTLAAENQHPKAQYELALFYMDEYDNPQAEQLTQKWMLAAAENAHEEAIKWVGQ